MESMEFNKICGAVLTAGIAFSALGMISDKLSRPHLLAESVLKIKTAEPAPAAAAAAPAGPPPISVLLAKADPAAGQAFTKKICIACHNFQEGGPNKVGPALYGVVGRDKASAPGYTYSAALKGKGGKWTFADLNQWLEKPKAYAPGTKMAYVGIDNDQTRANVIDYLRTLSKSPEPLPPVTAADTAAASGAAAPAAAPAAPSFDVLLAKADPARGQAFTKKICIACHNFQEGGPNKTGPALYGVVGRDKGSVPGYTYSAAMKAKGGKWTLADLNEWLTKPKAYVPGTKMSYAGIESPQQRADVVDYLRTLSKNPEPLPGAGTEGSAKPEEKSPGAAAPSQPAAAASSQPAAAAPPRPAAAASSKPADATPSKPAAAAPAQPSAAPSAPAANGEAPKKPAEKPQAAATAPGQATPPVPVAGTAAKPATTPPAAAPAQPAATQTAPTPATGTENAAKPASAPSASAPPASPAPSQPATAQSATPGTGTENAAKPESAPSASAPSQPASANPPASAPAGQSSATPTAPAAGAGSSAAASPAAASPPAAAAPTPPAAAGTSPAQPAANSADKPPVGAPAPDQPAVQQPAPVPSGTDHPAPSGQAPAPGAGAPSTAPSKPQ
jgi:cytochrome c